MTDKFRVAIVGAGPAGLSAAAHAAELGLSHVLLECTTAHANTIQRYQKGKHVMAEPSVLPLRSPLRFEAGSRENVLEDWSRGIGEHEINLRYRDDVAEIGGQMPDFALTLKDGEIIKAESVVFAIGVQGNPRKLGVEGEDLPIVQYTLDDPEAYSGETIIVVGAGDAAIENAVALAKQNTVYIVNRRDEFARAKEGNLSQIMQAIDNGTIQCYYNSAVARVDDTGAVGEYGDSSVSSDIDVDTSRPGVLVLNTEAGEARVPCDRIIGRIGAVPARKFVESCGIRFPNDRPTTLPELTERYETNVPGLHVIGALGGYPLIKQAMNQGYEVIEYLLGNDIESADEPLLANKFESLPYGLDVNQTLAMIQERIPVFGQINSLVFRELMLGSNVLTPGAGDVIFARNDYTDTFFTVLDGEVHIELGEEADYRITVGTGQFFGEMSLLSGRRRSGTVCAGENCVLIESPRREINKTINSFEQVKRTIDEQFIIRAIQTSFLPDASADELLSVAKSAQLNQFATDEALFCEGDVADNLHLIRSGSVAVSRMIGGRQIVTSYVAAGNYVGEMGLLGRTRRMATVSATVPTETISLDGDTFNKILGDNPALREKIQSTMSRRLQDNARMESQPEAGDIISFLMQQGLGEATDVLLIDESLCIGCNNCEKACAETHGGTSRLDREAGPSFATVHVPTSCRHCEDPHCMKDCPPDEIRRTPNGEVYIRDNCIGCGNCEKLCPYGVIQMAAPPPEKPGLASWLLFGHGPGPGEDKNHAHSGVDGPAKKAVKCDMCKDLDGGPACVRACPTGAALRLSPEQFVDLVKEPESL